MTGTSTSTTTTTTLELSTIAVLVFFCTNNILCLLFQLIRYMYPPYVPITDSKKKEKELSKPFVGIHHH